MQKVNGMNTKYYYLHDSSQALYVEGCVVAMSRGGSVAGALVCQDSGPGSTSSATREIFPLRARLYHHPSLVHGVPNNFENAAMIV